MLTISDPYSKGPGNTGSEGMITDEDGLVAGRSSKSHERWATMMGANSGHRDMPDDLVLDSQTHFYTMKGVPAHCRWTEAVGGILPTNRHLTMPEVYRIREWCEGVIAAAGPRPLHPVVASPETTSEQMSDLLYELDALRVQVGVQ